MRLVVVLLCLWTSAAYALTRPLLDIVDVQGERNNQLVGYGLVVGLSGTGDKNQVHFTSQSITNMLKQFGVQMPKGTSPTLKNVAAVMVSADINSAAGRGQTINVTVSSIGDAKSLAGGTLLMTPLKGIDGDIYAVAQGNLVVGGLKAEGNDGSSVQVNVPTVGMIPNGATIEKEVPEASMLKPQVVLNLKVPNFRTARNVELAINKVFGPQVASAQSSGRVLVNAPRDKEQRVVFMSMLQDLTVKMGRERPKVVFNSRTGTVVMGKDVRVHTAAVTQGNLTVTISEDYKVSQPNGFSQGKTVVTPDSKIAVDQEKRKMFVWPDGTSLNTIVQAVNSLGASPSDIMSILQALDQAGALEGDLVVI
ncbi:flagellar basal body P-ring protein FlgI [Gallaecimonas mangrovi]|uniref:flagellar basal body P-ring protein FlgI n=1 Tax=Gallaecimonas mangrovi TaxID=2291597 RepID=UPI000E20961A|nr:flagellar basal body P-ring protein FlgI [Gallaecimonas mangrovi]